MPRPSTERDIDSADWSGTDESITWQFNRGSVVEYPIVRFVNNTDVDLTVEAEVTDTADNSFSRSEKLTFYGDVYIGDSIQRAPGSESDNGTSITVQSGTVESRTIMQLWNKVKLNFSGTAEPSSGELIVVFID